MTFFRISEPIYFKQMTIPVFNKCCCCFPLTCGTIFLGWLNVIGGVLSFTFTIVCLLMLERFLSIICDVSVDDCKTIKICKYFPIVLWKSTREFWFLFSCHCSTDCEFNHQRRFNYVRNILDNGCQKGIRHYNFYRLDIIIFFSFPRKMRKWWYLGWSAIV
jgi:hypothetical protein